MNRGLSCCCALANRSRICFQKRRIALGFATLALLCPSLFDPVQAGNCPSNGNPQASLDLKLESVAGDQLDLSRYDGLQALILTNSQTRSQSEALSKSLALEFGQNPRLRQIVLVDGRGLLLVRNLVLQVIRESVPTDPRLVSPFVHVSVDFEGSTIQKLQEVAAEALPGINFRQQAALLLLDGQGTLLSGFADLEQSNLSIRRCIRTLMG
ncbi:hypothetical protein SYN63AY4M2_01230 [Synechococcus sp. 63AY4M2]|jgi:hypothetical protein|uniref:hypothetical protein n=1 Tax=Synechococcus sp. 63AY4M2 TaxID=1353266 RepID=UPI000C6A5AF1|nr:hypothetical protein [Synechococcus sp. 63AY4M2]PIK85197.1 hypothetical protein SYN63AY4M2_01230 [Synechococcus sp. 63AY4M2]